MPRYPNDMQSTPNKPSPREFDDRKRASAHYAEFYDPVDHNGAQRSPTRNVGGAMEVAISQRGQHQQRMVPVGQSRPPVTNSAPLCPGGASGAPRPPSYPGHPSEELLNKTKAVFQLQQQRRRGYRRGDELGEGPDQLATNQPANSRPERTTSSRPVSISVSNQSAPVTRDRPNHPSKNGPGSESPEPVSPIRPEGSGSLNPGTTIPRLNSPSVMPSVLQPLDKKVQEYDAQMHEAQNQMAQLDSEMAALQEQRREAEKAYMAAKTKHDDYRRQYQGVERALRGEPEPAMFSRLTLEK
ncbi:hypothetical protein B0J14DRAFT_254798 [Halenospora varia]|nr:hypothetical protein B0J14DRAFT_254798 [Halenospora varia]